jgi:glycine/D-amino acid oxidase-like deaminating enzyme
VSVDVAIIGGGIIGTAAAAFLAEAGLSVALFERSELAAGASGRNSGAIQHPFDEPFVELHRRSLELYRDLTLEADGFELAEQPSGLMLISFDESAAAATADGLARDWPDLIPSLLPVGAASALEPALHPGLAACRIETGYPVAPAAATLAFARRAERAGALLHTGSEATVGIRAGRVSGIQLTSGELVEALQVLVAAGPWTPSVIPRWSQMPPIRPVWGVVALTSLEAPPTHILEEIGIDRRGGPPDRMFSMVTTAAATSVGSTFLTTEPDARALAVEIVRHGHDFVPALAGSEILSVRACARPVAFDGRPIIGAVPEIDGLFVCAGHGPWGISTGPGSSRLIADQMLGMSNEREEFSPRRVRA